MRRLRPRGGHPRPRSPGERVEAPRPVGRSGPSPGFSSGGPARRPRAPGNGRKRLVGRDKPSVGPAGPEGHTGYSVISTGGSRVKRAALGAPLQVLMGPRPGQQVAGMEETPQRTGPCGQGGARAQRGTGCPSVCPAGRLRTLERVGPTQAGEKQGCSCQGRQHPRLRAAVQAEARRGRWTDWGGES